jgi:hypothetical protein
MAITEQMYLIVDASKKVIQKSSNIEQLLGSSLADATFLEDKQHKVSWDSLLPKLISSKKPQHLFFMV